MAVRFLVFNAVARSRIPLMMGNAQRSVWKARVLIRNKCGFSHDRSVEYRLDISLMPWGFKASSLCGVVSNHDER